MALPLFWVSGGETEPVNAEFSTRWKQDLWILFSPCQRKWRISANKCDVSLRFGPSKCVRTASCPTGSGSSAEAGCCGSR